MNAVRDRNAQENERGDGLARLGLEISRIKRFWKNAGKKRRM